MQSRVLALSHRWDRAAHAAACGSTECSATSSAGSVCICIRGSACACDAHLSGWDTSNPEACCALHRRPWCCGCSSTTRRPGTRPRAMAAPTPRSAWSWNALRTLGSSAAGGSLRLQWQVRTECIKRPGEGTIDSNLALLVFYQPLAKRRGCPPRMNGAGCHKALFLCMRI